jgi:hypothetical protein
MWSLIEHIAENLESVLVYLFALPLFQFFTPFPASFMSPKLMINMILFK